MFSGYLLGWSDFFRSSSSQLLFLCLFAMVFLYFVCIFNILFSSFCFFYRFFFFSNLCSVVSFMVNYLSVYLPSPPPLLHLFMIFVCFLLLFFEFTNFLLHFSFITFSLMCPVSFLPNMFLYSRSLPSVGYITVSLLVPLRQFLRLLHDSPGRVLGYGGSSPL